MYKWRYVKYFFSNPDGLLLLKYFAKFSINFKRKWKHQTLCNFKNEKYFPIIITEKENVLWFKKKYFKL